MADFSVVARIAADVSNFQNGMKVASDGVAQLVNGSSQLENVGNTMQSIGSGMTKMFTAPIVAGVGTVIKSYADMEQAIGGVETLFKGSAKTVIANSESAYKRAGISGVDYMEQVTSFSASLLQGLGGDTAKAAQYADKAVLDMADNANKFGTNIGDIQRAYQGFAKDNFTMLDNLKLGYGGTASEMARLVNESGVMGDSFKATAENVKDIPFDKLIEAIHVTQEEMGITGTTAKEASQTVSGSFDSMVAAAKNLVAGLGQKNADIKGLMKNLGSSIKTFGSNIKRVLSNIWDNLPLAGWQKWIAAIVVGAGPIIAIVGSIIIWFSKLKNALIPPKNPLESLTGGMVKSKSKIAQIIESIGTLFKDLGSGISKAAQGIGKGISTVFKGLGQGISTAAQGIGQGLSTIFMGIGRMTQVMNPVNMLAFAAAIAIVVASLALLATQSEGVAQILQALGSAISEIVLALGTAIGGIVESLGSALAQVAIAIGQAVATIITAVTPLVSVVGGIFVQLAGIVANAIVQIVQAIAPFIPAITEMVTAVVSQIPNIITAFAGLVTAVGNSISQIIQSVTGLISTIGPVLESAGQMFKDLGEGIKTALEGVQGVLETFGGIIETVFDGASQVIETFGDTVTRIMDSVRGIIQEIGDTATKIGDSFRTAADALQSLQDIDLWGIGGGLARIGLGMKDIMDANPQTIAEGLSRISEALANTFRVSALATDFQALGSALSGFPDTQTIATGLSAIGTALGTIFRVSALATDFTALKTALTGLGTFATQAGQGLTQLGTSATQLGSTMTTLKTTFTTSLNSMQTTATTVLNSIKSTFTSGMNSIKSTVTSGLNSVKSAFTSSFNAIKSTVTSSMNSTLSTVRSTMSSVVSAMNSAAGQARSAGYNMGAGFYSGLSAMAGSIIALAQSIASRAAAAMRSALRVHSPSRVTTKIGEYTGEGLGNGIANMRGYVERAATKLAGYAVPDISANDITGRMNALTTNQLDAGYQFSAGTLTVNQQPASIALKLGNSEYHAFVDDITDVQNKSADLRLAY